MTDTMHHRLTLALTPLIHHGIATPEEAATRVLEVMREPTEGMLVAGNSKDWESEDGRIAVPAYADQHWAGMIEAAKNGA